MPTEVYINPQAEREPKPDHTIMPGNNFVIQSFDNGVEYKFGVVCKEDDSRADLFYARKSDIPEIKGRIALRISNPLLSDANREGSIFSGQSYEYMANDRFGRAVRLVIKHARESYPPGQSPEEFTA